MGPEDNNVTPLFPNTSQDEIVRLPLDDSIEAGPDIYLPPQSIEEAISILQTDASRVERARLRALADTPRRSPGVISLDQYRQTRVFVKVPSQAPDIQGLIDEEAFHSARLFDRANLSDSKSMRFWYDWEGKWRIETIITEGFADKLSPKNIVNTITYSIEGGQLIRQKNDQPRVREPTLKEAQNFCGLATRYSTEIIGQVYRYLD